jgi:AbrB family looped-hinge helix DNA binding protein
MTTVTVSPKFQVVIPRDVRKALGISAGQKVQVVALGDRIEFILVKPPQAMRGFLRGIETTVKREKDRV